MPAPRVISWVHWSHGHGDKITERCATRIGGVHLLDRVLCLTLDIVNVDEAFLQCAFLSSSMRLQNLP